MPAGIRGMGTELDLSSQRRLLPQIEGHCRGLTTHCLSVQASEGEVSL